MRHDCIRDHHNCVRKREEYTVEDFIKAVYARPILWERHHTDYHNRDKRDIAWNEVATCLYSKYDAMTTAEKEKIVVLLTKRWKNTRDSFFRAQRRNRKLNGKNAEHPRAYIYQKELNFLLKKQDPDNEKYVNEVGTDDDSNEVNPKSPTVSKGKHEEDPIVIESDDDDDDDEDAADDDADVSNTPSRKKRRSVENTILRVEKLLPTVSCHLSNSNEVINVSKGTRLPTESSLRKKKSREHSTSTLNKPSRLAEKAKIAESDPDQSFFDSIKPVIQNLSMDQKLDFQIEILKLLKNFRGKH